MRDTEKKKDRDQRKRQREKRARVVELLAITSMGNSFSSVLGAQSDYTDLLPLVQSGKHMMSHVSLSPPKNEVVWVIPPHLQM